MEKVRKRSKKCLLPNACDVTKLATLNEGVRDPYLSPQEQESAGVIDVLEGDEFNVGRKIAGAEATGSGEVEGRSDEAPLDTPSDDFFSTPCFVVMDPVAKISGPIILGRWRDAKEMAFKNVSAGVQTQGKVQKKINLVEALDAILELRDILIDQAADQKTEGPQSVACERDLAHLKRLYCISFSKKRLSGWAIVFNFSDFASLTQDLRGNWLPECYSKTFEITEREKAIEFFFEQLQKSFKRLQMYRTRP